MGGGAELRTCGGVVDGDVAGARARLIQALRTEEKKGREAVTSVRTYIQTDRQVVVAGRS